MKHLTFLIVFAMFLLTVSTFVAQPTAAATMDCTYNDGYLYGYDYIGPDCYAWDGGECNYTDYQECVIATCNELGVDSDCAFGCFDGAGAYCGAG